MEEAAAEAELISPRISFSHDLATVTASPPTPSRRSDTSLVLSRLAEEPEFDFANATAADVAPADRLFAGGVLLPMPPLPPSPKPSASGKQLPSSSCHVKPPACQQQRRPAAAGSWASPFSRSSSVSSAATRGAPRSFGRIVCPSFPLTRSRSAGSAAVARDGFGSVTSDGGAGRRRQQHKKSGAAAAAGNGGSSRVYYYGGSNKKGSSHGVRVSPVINVPFIGTSVANVLSYLLCNCSSSKPTKCRGF